MNSQITKFNVFDNEFHKYSLNLARELHEPLTTFDKVESIYSGKSS